jgi:hypothetical protein
MDWFLIWILIILATLILHEIIVFVLNNDKVRCMIFYMRFFNWKKVFMFLFLILFTLLMIVVLFVKLTVTGYWADFLPSCIKVARHINENMFSNTQHPYINRNIPVIVFYSCCIYIFCYIRFIRKHFLKNKLIFILMFLYFILFFIVILGIPWFPIAQILYWDALGLCFFLWVLDYNPGLKIVDRFYIELQNVNDIACNYYILLVSFSVFFPRFTNLWFFTALLFETCFYVTYNKLSFNFLKDPFSFNNRVMLFFIFKLFILIFFLFSHSWFLWSLAWTVTDRYDLVDDIIFNRFFL